MNNKRAKRLRLLAKAGGQPLVPHYEEQRFVREDGMPTRTLFLTKCERAVYQRAKKLGKAEQDKLLKMMGGLINAA